MPFILSVNAEIYLEAMAVGEININKIDEFFYRKDFSDMSKIELLSLSDFIEIATITYEGLELLSSYI